MNVKKKKEKNVRHLKKVAFELRILSILDASKEYNDTHVLPF